jgi:AraC-like DNA-binding protein
MDVIQGEYARTDLRLAEIARRVGLSESRCEHLLKDCTGFSFRQHLHWLRVERAKYLLARTALSIKQIAGAVGYSRTSDLDRHFKRAVGLSPGAWRHHHAD